MTHIVGFSSFIFHLYFILMPSPHNLVYVRVCGIWSQRVTGLLKWPVSESELLSALFPSPPEPLTPTKKENKIMDVWRKRESKTQVVTGPRRWEVLRDALPWPLPYLTLAYKLRWQMHYNIPMCVFFIWAKSKNGIYANTDDRNIQILV